MGNDWIDYNQKYYRIKIINEGIYKIDYNTLVSVGMPIGTFDPRQLRIMHNGKEEYIYVKGEADGSFGASDYIEFYANKNDGWLDSAVYDKLDIHNNDWKDNDTVLVGMSHSQIFSAKLEPTLYGTMEYDTAGKIVNAGILGFSIKPHRRVYWNIEGGHHEINRDWNRTSIFSLFATGPLHQGRSEVSITLLEEKGAFKDVVLTGGYAYQRLKISSSVSENGHLANGGLGFHIIPLRLDTNLAYALYDSFGGRAHDVSVTLHDEPIDPLVVDAGANFTKYFKVTNDNDTAISAFLEAGIKIIKRLTFSANGEYLRNNTFDKEFRVMARLGYSLEGSI